MSTFPVNRNASTYETIKTDTTGISNASTNSTMTNVSTFNRIYLTLCHTAHQFRIPLIISDVSGRIYGRRRHTSEDSLSCLHILFALYSIPAKWNLADDSLLQDLESFRREAKAIYYPFILNANNVIKGANLTRKEIDAAQICLAGGEILSGNKIAACRRTEACLSKIRLSAVDADSHFTFQLIVLFKAFTIFQEGRANHALSFLERYESLFRKDWIYLKLIGDAESLNLDNKSSGVKIESYLKILDLYGAQDARTEESMIHAEMCSRMVYRALLIIMANPDSKHMEVVKKFITKCSRRLLVTEGACLYGLTTALCAAMTGNGSFTVSDELIKDLTRCIPDIGSPEELKRLRTLRHLAVRDFYLAEVSTLSLTTDTIAAQTSFAEILFDEWLLLWPADLLKEALESSSTEQEVPRPSYEGDIRLVIKAHELLAYRAMQKQHLVSALSHAEDCQKALRFLRGSDDDADEIPSRLTRVACAAICGLQTITRVADEQVKSWTERLDNLVDLKGTASLSLLIIGAVLALQEQPTSNVIKAHAFLSRAMKPMGTLVSHRRTSKATLSAFAQPVVQNPAFILPPIHLKLFGEDIHLQITPCLDVDQDVGLGIESLSMRSREQVLALCRVVIHQLVLKDVQSLTHSATPPAPSLVVTLDRRLTELCHICERSHSASPEQKELLLCAYEWLGRDTEAQSISRQLAARDSPSITALFWRALHLNRSKQMSDCLRICQKAWPLIEESPSTYARFIEMFASTLLQMADHPQPQQALRKYQALLSVDPLHLRAIYQCGHISDVDLNQPEKATHYYQMTEAAVVKLENTGRLLHSLGNDIRIKLRRVFDPFNADLTIFSRKDVRNFRLWSHLGLAHCHLRWRRARLSLKGSMMFSEDADRVELAAQHAKDALSIAHEDLEARNLLACALLRQRKYDQVMGVLSSSFFNDSKFYDSTKSMSQVLMAVATTGLRMNDIAIDHAMKAVEYSPTCPVALSVLTLVRLRADNHLEWASTAQAGLVDAERALSAADTAELRIVLECLIAYLSTGVYKGEVSTERIDEGVERIESRIAQLNLHFLSSQEMNEISFIFITPQRLKDQLQCWQILMLLQGERRQRVQQRGCHKAYTEASQLIDTYFRQAEACGQHKETAWLREVLILPDMFTPEDRPLLQRIHDIAAANAMMQTKISLLEGKLKTFTMHECARKLDSGVILFPPDVFFWQGLLVTLALMRWTPPACTQQLPHSKSLPHLKVLPYTPHPKIYELPPVAPYENGFGVLPLGRLPWKQQNSHAVKNAKEPKHNAVKGDRPSIGNHRKFAKSSQENLNCKQLATDNVEPALDKLCRVPLQIPLSKCFTPHDFQLNQLIGKGGFGCVYSGIITNTGQPVAVKILKIAWSRSIVKKVVGEVNIISNLQHPNLVRFVGVCLGSEQFSIITELCAGGSLHARLHQSKTVHSPTRSPLNTSTRCMIARQICTAVEYLHNQHPIVIHRDLKTPNVVLDMENNAKLCDFGLTSIIDADKTHISLRRTDAGGSPRYMAPECFSSEGKITEKVDIWALACVLIEVFGGPVPFSNCREIAQVIRLVVIDRKTPQVPSTLPPSLATVLLSCFAWDPKLRPCASTVLQAVCQVETSLRSS